ncbi:hypothetical protein [Sphaerisporangium dianthi]|uniref:Lysoplasmalogenase n=1 Tax=Sphaerisporangium dianthi TaxID=1436120 RepID=A0ABV9CRF6_9ACTN
MTSSERAGTPVGAGTGPRSTSDAAPRPGPGPDRGRWTAVLRRWPTALALGLAVVTLGGGDDPAAVVASVAEILLLLPLLYLVVAKLRSRRASWPTLAVLIVSFAVLRIAEVVTPAAAVAAAALVVLVWGAVDGQLRGSGVFRAQALGMIGFGALALAGLTADPDAGRYLVAAGWLLHGVWDFVHLRLGKVVARSYAEWCGVLDILIAAGLLLMF